MEQLFNPQLPGGGRPDIQLCIFPHLTEFLVIDAREDSSQVLLLKTEDVFDDEFYRTVEAEFSESLRSSNESPFSHFINLPVVVEETVRDIAMTFILDRLGVQVDDEDEIPSVVVYVVSGGALATHTGRILDGLRDLIHSSVKGAESDRWEGTISDLVEREMTIMQKLSEQQVTEAFKGDSPDYFTLWESRN
ncbi:MAG: hypothetical protein O3A93_02130 [Chloroflexi bacterium]|nr:hypothetical protein [Chloroflexota bacterium]MDA1270045.1 hypothetical protein [Chloroflexota bacterium]PKB58523.1 MAG: hypothetical protein BZY83_06635 [SAR202 cluster bacterium Casp-Chloro-G2]